MKNLIILSAIISFCFLGNVKGDGEAYCTSGLSYYCYVHLLGNVSQQVSVYPGQRVYYKAMAMGGSYTFGWLGSVSFPGWGADNGVWKSGYIVVSGGSEFSGYISMGARTSGGDLGTVSVLAGFSSSIMW